ncbi:MAG TPA: alpha-isopropylmalate synthase regulatory domain-containing protein [Candidatus Binataceae bacterium]|nr:alpha-isopropylmalate synthase regulatory domain-containing protein [Candidatus Binataceae bacterium]
MTEARKSLFEEAEIPQASRELAELRQSAGYTPPFEIIRRRVIDDYFEGKMVIDATVVIRIGDVEENEAARGVGVVHALDLALRKALLKYFPFLDKVRATETYTHASGESTEAEVMSIKKFSDGQRAWTTVAKSVNSVEAGWGSLVDGYEWYIHTYKREKKSRPSSPRVI